ncbi:MAG: hypothetical protein E7667_00105 [Ruminococcaceae bacterium]|nr:hypothetical protein [Oscillospiraceae bacterium]
MKYANSLKYIENFRPSGTQNTVSVRRISELCSSLGNINRGVRFIHVPGGASGHGCAVLMENVFKCAGYKTGRIVSPCGRDSRTSVFINGVIAQIEDYNKCVAEIKNKVGKHYDTEYLKEEIIFVLSLLLCRLSGCEFIILEGTEKFDRVCAPYELVIIPAIYDSENAMDKVVRLCDSIRAGAREVVSGNQKSDVYNYISNVCAPSGQRLFIPVKAQFCITEQSSRRLVFNYNGREGFTLKTPSLIMRDCAMTVIEAIMAIRREGIRIPVSAIIEGMAEAGSANSFEIISYTPTIIVDNSSNADETKLLYKTYCEVFGDDREFSICIFAESEEEISLLLGDIPLNKIKSILVCGHNYDMCSYKNVPLLVCRTHKDAARIISNVEDQDSTWVCFGGDFAQRIKEEIAKLINF